MPPTPWLQLFLVDIFSISVRDTKLVSIIMSNSSIEVT
jgi:hypothetical protein